MNKAIPNPSVTLPLPAPLTTPVFPAWWPADPEPTDWSGRDWPKITVITPSYNQAAYLEATIRSIVGQGYPNLELLVVDGGSTDHSVEIIRHYEKHITWWTSERDKGQTDAILKGLARATGDWINWINSDDLLAPGALRRIALATPDVDVVAGSVRNFSAKRLRDISRSRRFNLRAFIFLNLGGGARFHQPGVWLRREPLTQIGLRLGRHYKFDFEMLVRYIRRHPRVRYIRQELAFFRWHEESKTISQREAFGQEHVAVLQDLLDDPEFVAQRAWIDLALRRSSWALGKELSAIEDGPGSRWRALVQLWRAVQVDPQARCIRHSRKAALRLLRRGLWPDFWTSAARRRL